MNSKTLKLVSACVVMSLGSATALAQSSAPSTSMQSQATSQTDSPSSTRRSLGTSKMEKRTENGVTFVGQKLDEELKRYQYGRSSTDQVIRFQEDVLIAKRRAIEAKYQLVVSLIELDRRQGTLLGRYLTKDFLKE